MTSDLDQLRAVLRDRAALAPAPNDLLPRAHRLVRRRQVRRRVGLATGVVVVTALALVGASMFGNLAHNRSAHQPGRPLPPPTLPFSVGSVPAGYRLDFWDISDGRIRLDYTSGNGMIYVAQQNLDPVAGFPAATHTPTTVQGHPAMLSVQHQGTPTSTLSWRVGPDTWFAVTEQSADVNLSAIAASVRSTPTLGQVPLHIANLPDNLVASIWFGVQHQPTQETSVTLCPPHTSPPDRGRCVEVNMVTGTVPSDPVLGTNNATAATALRNRLPVIAKHGEVVTRQIDSTHWVTAKSDMASPALVLQLAIAATTD
jgi:hypothetical protein